MAVPTIPQILTKTDWDKQKGIIAKVGVGETGIGAEMDKVKSAYTAIVWTKFNAKQAFPKLPNDPALVDEALKAARAEIPKVEKLRTELRSLQTLAIKAQGVMKSKTLVPKSSAEHAGKIASAADLMAVACKSMDAELATFEQMKKDIAAKQVEDKKNVLKVKATLAQWVTTNKDYLTRIAVPKAKIKALKEEVKAIEGNLANPDKASLVKRIETTRKAVEAAALEGKAINDAHATWYLKEARGGYAPVLKANNLEEANLDKADLASFQTVLMPISQDANLVKNTYTTDVEAAAQALTVRLSNLEAQITKSNAGAVAEVRKNFTSELARIKDTAGMALAATKYEDTIQLAGEFRAKKGDRFQRLTGTDPKKFVPAYIDGINTRLKNIPTALADLDKQSSRLVKGIPPAFQNDPEILKLGQQLMGMMAQQKKSMATAEAALTECKAAMTQYMSTVK